MPRPVRVFGEGERGEGGEDLVLRGPGDEKHLLILEVPRDAAVRACLRCGTSNDLGVSSLPVSALRISNAGENRVEGLGG